MTWTLEYRSNNANDTIISVSDTSELVRSRWDATTKTVAAFADCTIAAEEWDGHFLEGEHDPKDFGDLVAIRNGYDLTVIDEDQWTRAVGFVAVERRHARADR